MRNRLGRAVATALAGTVVAAVAAGLGAWGCASESNTPMREHDWAHNAPDGGWQTYEPRQYDVDPLRSALGPTVPFMPTTAPVNVATPGIH